MKILTQSNQTNIFHPKTYQATVKSVEYLDHDIAIIRFTSQLGNYQAGQYITILLPNSSNPEGKAYSLASAPHEPDLMIAVRKIGEYSDFLYHLTPGSTFSHSQGYGHFNPNTTSPLVCLAAGVGISPIWSIIKHTTHTNPDQPISLAYSTRSTADAAFLSDIVELANNSKLKLFHHQTKTSLASLNKRINPEQYQQKDASYLICGSVSFVRDMWRSLNDLNINQQDIYTEVFFE